MGSSNIVQYSAAGISSLSPSYLGSQATSEQQDRGGGYYVDQSTGLGYSYSKDPGTGYEKIAEAGAKISIMKGGQVSEVSVPQQGQKVFGLQQVGQEQLPQSIQQKKSKFYQTAERYGPLIVSFGLGPQAMATAITTEAKKTEKGEKILEYGETAGIGALFGAPAGPVGMVSVAAFGVGAKYVSEEKFEKPYIIEPAQKLLEEEAKERQEYVTEKFTIAGEQAKKEFEAIGELSPLTKEYFPETKEIEKGTFEFIPSETKAKELYESYTPKLKLTKIEQAQKFLATTKTGQVVLAAGETAAFIGVGYGISKGLKAGTKAYETFKTPKLKAVDFVPETKVLEIQKPVYTKVGGEKFLVEPAKITGITKGTARVQVTKYGGLKEDLYEIPAITKFTQIGLKKGAIETETKLFVIKGKGQNIIGDVLEGTAKGKIGFATKDKTTILRGLEETEIKLPKGKVSRDFELISGRTYPEDLTRIDIRKVKPYEGIRTQKELFKEGRYKGTELLKLEKAGYKELTPIVEKKVVGLPTFTEKGIRAETKPFKISLEYKDVYSGVGIRTPKKIRFTLVKPAKEIFEKPIKKPPREFKDFSYLKKPYEPTEVETKTGKGLQLLEMEAPTKEIVEPITKIAALPVSELITRRSVIKAVSGLESTFYQPRDYQTQEFISFKIPSGIQGPELKMVSPLTIQKFEREQLLIQEPKIIQEPKQKIELISLQRQGSMVKQEQFRPQLQTPKLTQDIIEVPDLVFKHKKYKEYIFIEPITPKGFKVPLIPVLIPSLPEGGERGKKKTSAFTSKTEYKPSLYALEMGIRGKEPRGYAQTRFEYGKVKDKGRGTFSFQVEKEKKEKGILSGFELRPITKKMKFKFPEEITHSWAEKLKTRKMFM